MSLGKQWHGAGCAGTPSSQVIYTFMALLRIFPARNRQSPNYTSTYGGSSDWQHWHDFASFTMKQSPADWSWLTVTFPRVMRHVTAATVTPIYLTFVTAKLWKIAFKKSRPWPPIWLDTYARPTFQPKRYLSILFIECVQPLGFQWGELHCCYCWRFHLVDWNDPTWPQGQRTR